jgi:hypothetical protein
MTEQNPATYLQAGTHPAEGLRRMLDSLIGGADGVIYSSNLLVAERAAGVNMSVDVAGGRAFVRGNEATYQGIYHIENRGTANVVVEASDATHPRIDLVSAVVEDSAYSGGTDAWSLVVTKGTAAASPSTPAAPANSISLATVTLPALVTTVLDSYIADVRVTEGMFRWLAGTPDVAWTPSLPGGITIGNGTFTGSFYQKVGNLVTAQFVLTLGSTSTVASSIDVTLPVTAAVAESVHGTIRFYDTSVNDYIMGFLIPTSTTVASIQYGDTTINSPYIEDGFMSSTVPWTWATGDRIDVAITYLAA